MDGDSVSGKLDENTHDSKSTGGAIGQLLAFPRINSACTPRSSGGREATVIQGGKNSQHRGDPAADTADFNDERVGNLRVDYVLPSRNITVRGCGVYWPAPGEEGHHLINAFDHRLVWLDISL